MFPAGVLQDGAAVLLRERQHGEILGDGKGQWLKVHIHLPKGGCKMLQHGLRVSWYPYKAWERNQHSKTHHYHWEDPTLWTVFYHQKFGQINFLKNWPERHERHALWWFLMIDADLMLSYLPLWLSSSYGMITHFVWRTYFVWRYLITLVLYNFPTCILKFLSLLFPSFPKIPENGNLRVLGCFGICIGIHVLLEVVQPLLSFTDGFKVQGSIPWGGADPHPPKKPRKTGEKIKIPRARPWFFVCFAATVGFWKELGNCSEAQKASLPTPQCHAKGPPSG